MFRCVSEYLFWWPVTVRMPDPERPGSFSPQTCEVQFEALSEERTREIRERIGALPEDERMDHASAIVLEAARDWREVEDEAGVAVPFSAEMLTEQLRYPWFRRGVFDAYVEALSGQAARLGN